MREMLIPKDAQIVALLQQLGVADDLDSDSQEALAQRLLDHLVGRGVLDEHRAAGAELQDLGLPVVVVSGGDSMEWLEIDATCGAVYCVVDQGLD